MKSLRRLAVLVLASLMIGAGIVAVPAVVPAIPVSAAVAADPAGFDAGMIISDEVFYNAGALNAGQVQSFLTSKGASCRANSLPCLKDFTLTWVERPADAYCRLLPAGSGSAATYFVAVATSCGINPQVLLVLVEKEQSLVSRTNPSEYSYRYATGYACPDTTGCTDAAAGFSTQLYLAARQFQKYRLNPGGFRHQTGVVNQVLFHPDAARCGSSAVFIRNQATAGLYNYTPYQPNQAAINNLYSTGDGCSSYGNRNFWRMFTDWFGNTGSLLTAASFERHHAGWYFNSGFDRQIVGPTDQAHSGQYFLQMYAPRVNQSVYQDVRLSPQLRDVYTATIWVKSGSASPHTGALTLWGLGGQTEVAQTVFTVGSTWTQVSVSLPIAQAGHTALRVEIYLQTPTAMLAIDDAAITRTVVQQPVLAPTLVSPSLEEGIGAWSAKNGAPTLAVVDVGTAAHHGTKTLVVSTPTAGRSVGQDIGVTALRGESYTATVWARASDAAGSANITMALWGIGPSGSDVGAAVVTVGTTWTPITASMTVAQASVTRLRLELYLMTPGVDIWLDDASLVPNLAGNPSFETSTALWNNGLSGAVLSRILGTPQIPAVDGQYIATTDTRFGNGSFATDVFRRTTAGETYTATLWLRSAVPGETWDGGVALWGLGGGDELGVIAVSIPDTWTLVTVTLPTNVAHSALRLEVYNGSPGEVLYVDGAMIR